MPGGDPLATCTLPVGDVYLLTYLHGADGRAPISNFRNFTPVSVEGESRIRDRSPGFVESLTRVTPGFCGYRGAGPADDSVLAPAHGSWIIGRDIATNLKCEMVRWLMHDGSGCGSRFGSRCGPPARTRARTIMHKIEFT